MGSGLGLEPMPKVLRSLVLLLFCNLTDDGHSERMRGMFAGLTVCKAIWLLCLIKAAW